MRIFCFLLISFANCLFAQDYTIYHKSIIEAEQTIFIEKDSVKGLEIFNTTFCNFDFVFIDDCVEAFQLALYFKREDLAMVFIEKALQNGLVLKNLDYLCLGNPNNGYVDRHKKVEMFKDFIKKNEPKLVKLEKKYLQVFLKKVDRNIYNQILKRHVREQLFKGWHKGLCTNFKIQDQEYNIISESNLNYIDSLAQNGIYVGEKLLGLYSDNVADSLDGSTKKILEKILRFYKMPIDTKVPIKQDNAYWDFDPTYNILVHNKNSYSKLLKYKNKAIKEGYWHPREFISLKFFDIRSNIPPDDNMYLEKFNFNTNATKSINKMRAEHLLPSIEIDDAKQKFAIKNHLQLSFGFSNGTR